MGFFPKSLRKLLQGNPWGEVFPPKPNPPPLSVDGRTVALRLLREYVTNLTFFRAMGPGRPPEPFRIKEENFQIEWPDSTQELELPAVAIVGSRASYDAIGLTSYVEENTRDVFAPGTVVQWQSERVETIQLEIWASKKSERRAILAGLETALTPTEQMYGLRFRMPDYFDELVCFSLGRGEVMDDPDSARNRRRAQLEIEMRFNVVALVNYVALSTATVANADVDQFGVPVSVDEAAGDLAGALADDDPPNPAFDP